MTQGRGYQRLTNSHEELVVHVSRRRLSPSRAEEYSQCCPRKKTIFTVFILLILTASTLTFKQGLRNKNVSSVDWKIFETKKNNTKVYRNITILMWVPFFGHKFGQQLLSPCPELNCRITHNRDALDRSSAVVYHDRDVNISDLPQKRLPQQHYVFFLLESPYHTSGRAFHQLSANFYTLTMNYRRDADVHIPYGYFKPRSTPLPSNFRENLRKLVASKSKLVAWFASNCQTPSAREFYVKQLQAYIKVDVYGRCGPLRCPRGNSRCFEALKRNYKFYIAFENSVCTDYVTEKYFDRLNDFVVPIVFGRKIYEAIGPNNSFIAADDFRSPKELADYLKRLDRDDDRYLKYFEWMNQEQSFGGEHRYADGFCNLCRKLQEQQEDQKASASETAKNLTAWYVRPGICHERYGTNVRKL